MNLLERLWKDETGAVISTELVLVSSVGVVGLLGGLQTVRDAVVGEMTDMAVAVQKVNQSYLQLANSVHQDDATRDGRSATSRQDDGGITLFDPQELP